MDDRQYRQLLDKFVYRDQLDAFTDLLSTTEEALAKQHEYILSQVEWPVELLNESADAVWPKMSPEQYKKLLALANQSREVGDEYPNLVRMAMLISVLGYVEYVLNEICRRFEPPGGISIEDLKDKGLRRAKVYLVKVIGIESPGALLEAEELELVALIRNQATHAFGTLSDEKAKRLKKLIEKHRPLSDVTVDDQGRLRLGKGFVGAVINRAEKSLDEVIYSLLSKKD
jgi:hypothetical protein